VNAPTDGSVISGLKLAADKPPTTARPVKMRVAWQNPFRGLAINA
jgi:hypothetical protein